MGVLELTLLRLKPGVEPTDPLLLKNLRDIRAQLKTNSRFYIDTNDPSKLYILGLWPTMEAHHAFLASPDRERILGPQEGQTEFVWGIHIGDVSTMDDLPLQADIMFVSRITCPSSERDGTEGKLHEEVGRLRITHGKFPILFKKRIDAVSEGAESIVIYGIDKEDNIGSTRITLSHDSGTSTRMEGWQARDLEREADSVAASH